MFENNLDMPLYLYNIISQGKEVQQRERERERERERVCVHVDRTIIRV
jgi:hypothetical protein